MRVVPGAPPRAFLCLALPTLLGAAIAQAPRTPFPEGCATIEHLVLHFDPTCVEEWLPVCRDLSMALPKDVRITVAVSGREEAAAFHRAVGDAPSRPLEVLEVGAPVTSWARDRMLALGAVGRAVELVTPPADRVESGYDGDLAVAVAWARRNAGRSTSTPFWFEGGDVACSGTRLFVGWGSVLANADEHRSTVEAVGSFERLFGTPVIVVGKPIAPHAHLDMYMTVLDERTILLGDPIAGADLLQRLGADGEAVPLPGFDEWTDDCQRAVVSLYTAAATQLRRAGLRVVRVPILHGERGGVLTWNNALVERRAGAPRAYVPSYGVPLLDEAAHSVYRAAGCRVLPIDVAAIAPHGGTVRCLTNVVAWRRPVGP